MRLSRHPSDEQLRRFAAKEATVEDRSPIARHLTGCDTCRRAVSRDREILRHLRDAGAATPPDVWDRIVARRDEGERVAIPEIVTMPQERRHRWRAVAAAVPLVLAGGLAVGVISTPRAQPAFGELQFEPAAPLRGAEIEVVYRPMPALAGLDSVILRGRLRTDRRVHYNHGPLQRRIATLKRVDGGAFRGSFTLQDSVVYGAFAVEDVRGMELDDNRNKLWELEVYADGRPLLEALTQRHYDFFGRSWEGRLESARRLTQYYPAYPTGWSYLLYLERGITPPEKHDSMVAEYRTRTERFHRELAHQKRIDAPVMEAMAMLGVETQLDSIRLFWVNRIENEHPQHPIGVDLRAGRLGIKARRSEEPHLYLQGAERLWTEIGDSVDSRYASWFNNPTIYAKRAGDADAFFRWAERVLAYDAVSPPHMLVPYQLERLLEWPELRDQTLELAERYAREWAQPRDAERPLSQTVDEYARERAAAYGRILAILGRALVVTGDTAQGIATLHEAFDQGWDPRVFEQVARALIQAGDTATAIEAFALMAVDPSYRSYTDSARALGVNAFDETRWNALTAKASRRMHEETMADAEFRRLPSVALRDANGARRSLRLLLDGTTAVIAYWSPYCYPAVQALPAMDELGEWLAERGAKLIVLTERNTEDAARALREAQVTFDVYYDVEGEARDALNKFRTPSYWVVDGSGRVVFDHSDLSALRRQVVVVSELQTS